MLTKTCDKFLHPALLEAIFIAPFVLPNFNAQLAALRLMIIVALTWDMTGRCAGHVRQSLR